jgi:serine/threonine-protein kinase HipA
MTASRIERPSVLEVLVNQTRVGSLTNLPYDRNLFVFDDAYIQDVNRPLLSLNNYDARGELTTVPQEVQTKVPPFFSNLLPEGKLREYVSQRGGIKQAREFFLLWLLGTDLPGAVVVQDAEGRSLPPRDENKEATQESRRELLRFSLAGVQLKFSAVGSSGKQLTIPTEGRGGYWIVKLPSSRYAHVPENEYSMMTLAHEVGIDVAEVGLVPTKDVDGLPAELQRETANSLYVRRFDRTPEGERIHIEDFNQVYGQFPDDKYRNYSYTNMAGDIWRILGEADLLEFVRRLVFSAAIGNADMHLKNWSVTYPDGRKPKLAPGYDFVSTIAYIDDRKMSLSIAKEKDTKFLDEQLLERFAAKARIPTKIVLDTALAIAERTVNAWEKHSSELPIGKETRDKIDEQLRYVPLTRRFMIS